ncbi:MAG: acetoacetate--CoA ligase [Acidimicrobiaceae bacterium]|nr:acetoacetate--CoA ligase [Acidimicrobiaceae bacterium]
MTLTEGLPIWEPQQRPPRDSELDRFIDYLNLSCGLNFDNYADLWKFSVTEIEAFWDHCWRYFNIVGTRPPSLAEARLPIPTETYPLVLTNHEMPGFRFFPGSMINFAENVFRSFQGNASVIATSETRPGTRVIPAALLWDEVSRIADGLRGIGVSKGDRVVGYLPNIEEALIAFLAASSVGAIWSCCAPDFGPSAVIDRFGQIKPKVLFTVDGYVYSGKPQSRKNVVEEVTSKIPSIEVVVLINYMGTADTIEIDPSLGRDWEVFGRKDQPLYFERVEFSDPLWILYSSGTTGLPKPIVHGHGGITLELLKEMTFQLDLHAGSRFFWFTTTGWMMWNFLVGGMLVGSDIVLFDGNPGYPNLFTLWKLADELEITAFGTSAPYIASCIKAEIGLKQFNFPKLKMIGSTGAPLSLDGFEWLHDELGPKVQIISASGGTDVCTAFLASSPISPTYAGKLSARALGAAVESYSSEGQSQYGDVGELVITEPMPSMPVFLWGDSDGTRIRSSYFDTFSGVWSHGDWIRIDPDGSSVIFGRSDSTLNRGGVRMGTAEFYRIIEGFEEVADSLIVDTSILNREGELIAFLVLKSGAKLSDGLTTRISTEIRSRLSPRHVPNRWIAITEIPRTLNGKKLEIPVRRILLGESLDSVISLGAMANPESLNMIKTSIINDDQPRV